MRKLLEGVTWRAFTAGQLLAMVLCFVNSYITLKVGVMDEGYAVSVLIFNVFISMFAARKVAKSGRMTPTEAVVVGTMGSAGGSTGFLANFFGAMHMFALETNNPGAAFGFWEIAVFTLVSSLLGVVLAVPMVRLFVIANPLYWPIGVAAKETIKVLTDKIESMQPRVLSFFAVLFGIYMVLSGGIEWFPEISLVGAYGLSQYLVGVAWSPFLFGAGFLIGLRLGWGFFVGAVIMFAVGAYLPPEMNANGVVHYLAPHSFMWPGVIALTTAGLAALIFNLPTVFRTLKSMKFVAKDDDDRLKILRGWKFMVALLVAYVLATIMLTGMFKIVLQVVIMGLMVGTVVLNLIAVLSFGNTGFNPVRVMGILLMVVFVIMGENAVPALLVAAGLAASVIGQTAIMTQDVWVGNKWKISPLGLMILQISTFIPVSIAMAFSFEIISSTFHFPVEGANPKDPMLLQGVVMKAWYVMATLFSKEGVSSLPDYAVTSMWLGGTFGIVLAICDRIAGKYIGKAAESKPARKSLWRFMPHSLGITIAMILPIAYSVTFALGALVLCYVLPKWLKTGEDTLTSISVAGIIGEGIGGPLTAIVKSLISISGGR